MSEQESTLQSAVKRVKRKLTRAVLPRLLLRATETSQAIRERVARSQWAFGLSPEVELYFAFDDPYGAIAVTEVVALTRRYGVELVLCPVVDHGIPSDPDLFLRRA